MGGAGDRPQVTGAAVQGQPIQVSAWPGQQPGQWNRLLPAQPHLAVVAQRALARLEKAALLHCVVGEHVAAGGRGAGNGALGRRDRQARASTALQGSHNKSWQAALGLVQVRCGAWERAPSLGTGLLWHAAGRSLPQRRGSCRSHQWGLPPSQWQSAAMFGWAGRGGLRRSGRNRRSTLKAQHANNSADEHGIPHRRAGARKAVPRHTHLRVGHIPALVAGLPLGVAAEAGQRSAAGRGRAGHASDPNSQHGPRQARSGHRRVASRTPT